ncbi:hypothetical protein LJB88_01155 [Erysipelotrichaceae bacterium OttesenSCG-928-M19]|nr:hypothetical protein [Erysipelotrichaceae bacterium OttesenSCG-928-M19]
MVKNNKEILKSVLEAFPISSKEEINNKNLSETEYLISLIDQCLAIK